MSGPIKAQIAVASVLACLLGGSALAQTSGEDPSSAEDESWFTQEDSDYIDKILDAPIESGPFAKRKAAPLATSIFGATWSCETDPPGDEVGVKTVMSFHDAGGGTAAIKEINFIDFQPRPIEVDMHYKATYAVGTDGELSLKTVSSTMGSVRNWPKGMQMNPPGPVEMALTATSAGRLTGWTRSYGVTSSIDCRPR